MKKDQLPLVNGPCMVRSGDEEYEARFQLWLTPAGGYEAVLEDRDNAADDVVLSGSSLVVVDRRLKDRARSLAA